MKVLIDENLPHDLRHFLPGHADFTVAYMGWSGSKHGALLAVAAASGFEALVTLDSGIEFEQHLATLPCSVVVLHARSNKLADVRPLVANLINALSTLTLKSVVHIRP